MTPDDRCTHECPAHIPDEQDGSVWVRVNTMHVSSVIPEIEAMLYPLDPNDQRRVVAWFADEYLRERDA